MSRIDCDNVGLSMTVSSTLHNVEMSPPSLLLITSFTLVTARVTAELGPTPGWLEVIRGEDKWLQNGGRKDGKVRLMRDFCHESPALMVRTTRLVYGAD